MTFIYFTSIALFIFVCFLLSGVILMQESKSSGLGSSFGGDAGESVFGTSTADVLKKFTAWLALIFFVFCLLLSFWTSSMGRTHTSSAPISIENVESA